MSAMKAGWLPRDVARPDIISLPFALHELKTRNAKARIRLNGQSSIRNRLATASAPSIVLGLHQPQSVLDPLEPDDHSRSYLDGQVMPEIARGLISGVSIECSLGQRSKREVPAGQQRGSLPAEFLSQSYALGHMTHSQQV